MVKVVYFNVPVVNTGLGLSVPQTDLHASRNVNGETSLKLRTCLQTRLELDDLKDSKYEEIPQWMLN